MAAIVEFRALNGVQLVDRGEATLSAVALQPKQLAIFTYLAGRAPGDSPRARDTILRLFWPESDASHARAAMRQAIYEMRRALGDGVVLTDRGNLLCIEPDRVRYDVWSFHKAIDAGDLAQAIELRQRPFLDGFFVLGAPEFERWVASERDELDRRYRRALESLCKASLESGDLVRSLEYGERWAREDPYGSGATLFLMQILELTGDRASALRVGERHEVRLREDLGAEPDPEVMTLGARIRQAPVSTVSAQPHTSAPQLVAPFPLPREPADRTTPATASQRRRRTLFAAAISVALLTALMVITQLTRDSSLAPSLPRVALLAFENLTGDPSLDLAGETVIRSIGAGLAELGTLDVIPFGEPPVSFVFRVTGSYYRQGDSVEFLTEILDEENGRALPAPRPIRAPLSNPISAALVARHRAMGALAYYTGVFGAAQKPGRQPPPYEAYLAFSEGLQYMFDFRPGAAEQAFRRTIELDPAYTEAYMLLAGFSFYNEPGPATPRGGLWGRFDAMDSLARAMRRAIVPLTEPDRHVVMWLEAAARGDLKTALTASVRLSDWLPAANYGIGFRGVWANQPSIAMDGLGRLDPDRGWTREWSWYWAMRTAALHELQQYDAELRAAQDGLRRFPNEPAIFDAQLRAMAALGDLDGIRRLANDLPANTCLRLGLELSAHGQPAEAEQYLTRVADRTSDGRGNVGEQYWRAVVLATLNRLDEAVAVLERLAAEDSLHLGLRGMLGTAYARQGKRASALRQSRELGSVSGQYLHGLPNLWQARIAAQLHEHSASVQLLAKAFTEGVIHFPPFYVGGTFWHSDPDLEPLRGYGPYEDLIRPR